jgi:ribosomal protein S18 acetylase RimI-like enzyme
MYVRQLTSQDAAAYQSLRLGALQESPTAFSSSYEQEAAMTPAEIATRVTPAANGSFCVFGVSAEEELAGFLAFIRPQREKLRHCAELAGTYVAPKFRRRGFGRALVNAVVAHARSLDGVRQVKLGVNATNTAARLLYRSVGFRRFGVEPDALCVGGTYYDEELYVLRLNPGT